MADRPLRLGAHVPTRGHPANAIEEARSRDAGALQIFVSNPRAWAAPSPDAEVAREFRDRRRGSGVEVAVAHASYLVNIASPSEDLRIRSVELARREAAVAAGLGLDGLVIHAGAGGPGERTAALERAAASALSVCAEGAPVLLELTAGGRGSVASTIPEAADLLDACGRDPRIGLVLDTCHLFAAGAPLDDPDGVRRMLRELRDHRLVRRLRVVHANDSRDPRGSRRDRHEHVGRGHIGEQGFRAILADPAVRRAAVLIETPGRLPEDLENLATLRRLAGS